MRKITSLLSLLFMMMGGVMFAQAQTPAPTDVPEVTTDIKNPICYSIQSARSKKYLTSPGSGKPTQNASVTDEALWYVTGSSESGYTLCHWKSGKNLQTSDLNVTEGASTWYIFKNPHNDKGVVISKTKEVSSKSCIDDQSGSIGWWAPSASDNLGTTFIFTKQETPTYDYAELIKNAYDESKLSSSSDDSYVGYIAADKKQIIKAAKDEALSNPSKESYEKLLQTIKENSVGFEANAYYLIENQNGITKKYPSTQNMHFGKDGGFPHQNPYDDRVVRRVTNEDPLLPRLWKIEKQNNGSYKIRNANTGCNWSSYVNNGIDMPVNPDAGGNYEIQFIPCTPKEGVVVDSFNTKFTLRIEGRMINAYDEDNNNILSDYGGNHIGDAGNHWSFKKITEVPVKIGATGWASVCMPFAVTIPASVQAYVATSAENDVVTLTEVKGTVPAKTAMLITGQKKSSANFAISTETGQTIAKNLFKGTTTERINFNNQETFALGVKADNNGVALMRNALTKEFPNGENNKYSTVYVPANKAYILTTDLSATAQAASMLQFNFGGEATGIDGVVADDAKETIYYDLNGRRVLYPTQGVYVTNTGKKVFIR